MKKCFQIILLLICSLVFISCDVQSGVVINGNLTATKESMKGFYEKFDGKYYKRIKLNKSDIIECTTNIDTKNGQIDLLLVNKDDDIVANLDSISNIEILEDGYYYFTVICENHSGSFEIQWNKCTN